MTSKVLLLFEYGSLNGGEHSILALLEPLRQAGFNLTAAAPQEGPLFAALMEKGVPTTAIDWHAEDGSLAPLEERRRRVKTLLIETRPVLLHANSLAMSRLGGPVAKHLGIASIGHLRDIIKVSKLVIADLNCHTKLLAVSQATKDFHVAAGLDPSKTEVLYNGIDLEEFRPRPAQGYMHRELGLPADAMLIGTIGQIGIRKGLDVLLEAAGQVVSKQPLAHFLIVGQRYSQKQEALEFEANLHAVADLSPLRGRVHFLGRRSDIAQLMNELTLLAHAAHQEPLGRVLLEAAGSGLPVVATDVGGTKEIFPNQGSEAILVPAADPSAMAKAIIAVLSDKTGRNQIASGARRRCEQTFDARTAGLALAKMYQQTLAEN